MLKKTAFTIMLIALVTIPLDLLARRGCGSGFGLGLLGGALITSAVYNNNAGYGYYPPQPYPYTYGPYGRPSYGPYW